MIRRTLTPADLGWELIEPLAKVFTGARCIDAQLRRGGAVIAVTVWPPEGEALTVVIPTRGLLEELGGSL